MKLLKINIKLFFYPFFIFFISIYSVFGASTKITYQGQLREEGVPVTANKDMEFRIFTSSTGGTATWMSGVQTVSVISGLFRTLLEPVGVDWESTIYLELEVEGVTLSPREELTASPYAINAQLLAGKAYTNSALAPSSPAVGDFWFNTSLNSLNVWSGTTWDKISSGGSGGGTVTIENGDAVVEIGASRIDFSGTYFIVKSGPSGEANISLSSGSIMDSHISAMAAIQYSKLEKDPSQTGVINTSTNPIDWSMLKNVPVDFADGLDNLGAGTPVASENGVVVDAAAGTFDFLGAHFDLTSSPPGEANVSLNPSSVTLRGNSFNGANELVQLNGAGELPSLSGANLTNIPAGQLAGTVASALLETSSVTKKGNMFNGVNSLVLLDGSGNLPALNGSALTSVTAVRTIEENNVPIVTGAISLDFLGAPFNVTSDGGTEADVSLDPSSVTLQGNSFNAASQLVKLDSSGGLSFNSGSTILKHLTATKAISFSGASNGSCEADTIGVPGAVDGDTIVLGLPSAIATSDTDQIIYAYVSSNDVVTVRRCMATDFLGGSLAAASGTIRVDVWKH